MNGAEPDRLAEQVYALVAALPDPEIPAVNLADLGILRGVRVDHAQVVVHLTPTYTGCPATEAIKHDVLACLRDHGHADARVQIDLAPPWSSDWITEAGRVKLRAFGIAAPACATARADHVESTAQPLRFVPRAPKVQPACPRCDSADVEQLSYYGSTPCKALYRCLSCREPFDYFKTY